MSVNTVRGRACPGPTNATPLGMKNEYVELQSQLYWTINWLMGENYPFIANVAGLIIAIIISVYDVSKSFNTCDVSEP